MDIFLTFGVVVVPVIGWVVGIGIGAITTVLGVSNFTGMWKRTNCFDDIMMVFYQSIIDNKTNMIKTYRDNYKDIITNFCKTIAVFAKDTKPILEFRAILDKYDTSEVNMEYKEIKYVLEAELEKMALDSNKDMTNKDMTKIIDFFKTANC